MKGTFKVAEAIALMHGRVPYAKPPFRLQNFLAGDPNWQTSQAWGLHIGERGEMAVLYRLLGPNRLKSIVAVEKKYGKGLGGGARLFPTKRKWNAFLRDISAVLGEDIEFEV